MRRRNISLNTVMLREGSQVRAAFPAKTQMDFKPTVEARGKERRGSKKAWKTEKIQSAM